MVRLKIMLTWVGGRFVGAGVGEVVGEKVGCSVGPKAAAVGDGVTFQPFPESAGSVGARIGARELSPVSVTLPDEGSSGASKSFRSSPLPCSCCVQR
jgi:hypothetical protein